VLVSFLPAFWLLVPGALGLVGVTQILGAEHTSGLDSLVTAGATMIGIAFGVLLGLAAATGMTAVAHATPLARAGHGAVRTRDSDPDRSVAGR
jgi:uncharacterized membrane protein YjjB (DUF3815 family)